MTTRSLGSGRPTEPRSRESYRRGGVEFYSVGGAAGSSSCAYPGSPAASAREARAAASLAVPVAVVGPAAGAAGLARACGARAPRPRGDDLSRRTRPAPSPKCCARPAPGRPTPPPAVARTQAPRRRRRAGAARATAAGGGTCGRIGGAPACPVVGRARGRSTDAPSLTPKQNNPRAGARTSRRRSPPTRRGPRRPRGRPASRAAAARPPSRAAAAT